MGFGICDSCPLRVVRTGGECAGIARTAFALPVLIATWPCWPCGGQLGFECSIRGSCAEMACLGMREQKGGSLDRLHTSNLV